MKNSHNRNLIYAKPYFPFGLGMIVLLFCFCTPILFISSIFLVPQNTNLILQTILLISAFITIVLLIFQSCAGLIAVDFWVSSSMVRIRIPTLVGSYYRNINPTDGRSITLLFVLLFFQKGKLPILFTKNLWMPNQKEDLDLSAHLNSSNFF